MDLQPWGFGHGSSAMDLEKMNIKFKTQKIWIKPRLAETQNLKPYFKPLHQQSIKHKNQTHIFGPQTQNSKPKFSYFQRNQTETSNPNQRAKIKPLATSDLKLSNPNRINLRPAKTEFTAFFFLMFAWGVDLRGQGREEKRDIEDGIVWVLMKRRGWKTKKENVVLVFKFGLVFFFFFSFFFSFFLLKNI